MFLKSVLTAFAAAVIVDTVKVRCAKQLKTLEAQKPKTAPVRKNESELKLWYLTRASSNIACRERHGDYIAAPADQQIVDLEFNLIIARNM